MERERINYYLQHVPHQEIILLCGVIETEAVVECIQKPTSQTLLVPVQDPINQGSFISGEVLVTSAIIQVNGVNGWSMVMDDNPDLAGCIAIVDGAFAAALQVEAITALAEKGKRLIAEKCGEMNAQVESTRVVFDLL